MPAHTRRRVLAWSAVAGLTGAASARAATSRAPLVGAIALKGDRLRMPVMIGGRGPFDFAVDTGAPSSGVDDALARQLGLHAVATVGVGGFGGSGQGSAPLYLAHDVVLGGVARQGDMQLTAWPVLQGSGAGMLAAGVFTSIDSDIDLDQGRWSLYPGGRPGWEGWTRVPSTFDRGALGGSARLIVSASLDGWTGRFMLDTGAPSTVSLASRAAVAHGYWSDQRPFAPVPTGGVMGRDLRPSRLVRAGELRLGPVTVKRPLMVVRDPRLGDVLGSMGLDGLIGLGLMRQVNLGFDTAGHAVMMQGNNVAPTPERPYARTGLWLDRLDGGRARVALVSPASPAADAGLRPGDVLAVTDFTAFLRRSHEPAGTSLVVDRLVGDRRESLTLTLRDYL